MALGNILNVLLPYIIPCKFRVHAIDELYDSTSVIGNLYYCDNYHGESVQLFITSESTITINCKSAYNENFIIDTNIKNSRTHKPIKWTRIELNKILQGYISALK